MVLFTGCVASAAVSGMLYTHPTLLNRGTFLLTRKSPSLGQSSPRGASCDPYRHRPLAASSPSPGGNGASGVPPINVTAVSNVAVVTEYTSVSSLPWKVQWQLQGSVEVSVSQVTSSARLNTDLQPQSSSPELSWTPFDRTESVRLAALEVSGWDPELFNSRFADLAAVLPDLPRVLPSLTPVQLVAAMSDTHAMAAKVVLLKATLPSTNVGMLLLLHPPFLDPAYGAEQLLAGVEHASQVLGGLAVAEEVIQWYPPLMDPMVLDASVAQLRRLVPHLARNCLPGLGRASGPPNAGVGGTGSGDARQLVHLLGIVMQREGMGVKDAEGDNQGSLWWGCA
ncbi:hypothetical protein Vretimale_10345 [Volvox reticuliferus]|uniref:Uncharacterized protein n=1 Tax=Volvox reticuliferus TaxID=1737510 RepID=A0A8J4FTC8_9CHLO|nr:hypothetical protein Vretifemale_12312 [Volvox reticuliferus]GIM05925.1 hypothetical protein Vretimale_10345 [Volvox reticuliferus]